MKNDRKQQSSESRVMPRSLFAMMVVLELLPSNLAAQSSTDINSILRGGVTPPKSQTPRPSQPAEAPGTPPSQIAEDNAAKNMKPSELRAAGTQSSVFIFINIDEKHYRTGTGFFLSQNRIFTNSHVVEDASAIIVVGHDRQRFKGKVLANSGTNAGADFAVIELDRPASGRPISFSMSYAALASVHAFGFPGKVIEDDAQFQSLFKGDKLAMPTIVASSGSVQNVMQNRYRAEVITHSAQISQGNSGGPLFDACGRVVGINTYIDATTIVSNDPKGNRKELTVRDGYQYALSSKEMVAFMQSRGITAQIETALCD